MAEISLLFQSLKVGQLTLKNRVIMGSMHVGLEGGEGAALIQFYKERSGEHGPALIITGGIAVSPEGEGGPHFMGFYREKDVQVMKKLTAEVHQAGGRIAAQLFHAGRYGYPELTGIASVAPSPFKSPIHRVAPRELNSLKILHLIKQYGKSALTAKDAGFDAVEIMGSEGYLINQFLSPATNQRNDEWGGNFEKRTRFALAILREVRQAVGPDYPIIFRLSGADLVPNSTTAEETIQFAQLVEEHGADMINAGIGWHESQVPTISMMVPRAGFIHIAKKMKEVVTIPVIGSNRINDPLLAEKLLQEGQCDLISMARPFLADPYILQKAKAQQYEQINTCIACNQACLDHAFEGKPVSCLVNPKAGREYKWKPFITNNRKNVIVLGGGAAGMEAARSLAEVGHSVTLYEEKDELGGQLNLAKLIPGKQEFYETLRYYMHELERLAVQVFLSTKPTTEELISLKPDLVVVATGVQPRRPSIPGVEHSHVVTYQEVLSGQCEVGKHVVIIGAGGIGCDLSHYLLDQGEHEITILRRKGKMGQNLGKTTKWALISHILKRGATFYSNLNYEAIEQEGITISIQNPETSETVTKKIPADTIILAAGQEKKTFDEQPLLEAGIEVVRIGGAKFSGELDAKRAIYEGACLAYEPESLSS